MIAVIADDFTGAAEIGGVGLRYGLKVLIETVVNKVEDVDLLVIATDTRSLSVEAASDEVSKITKQLMELEPELIFKKIDSVLRGNVTAELEAQMKMLKKHKALIVAANPSVGRTIVNGQYFIDSLALNQTSFANDPDFPVLSSYVTDIVQSSEYQVVSLGLTDELPASGLLIANVASPEELAGWAVRIDNELVVAGGSGYFDTLLASRFEKKITSSSTDLLFGESSLFIFGSMYPKHEGMMERFYNNKVVRSNMPAGVYANSETSVALLDDWSVQVAGQLKKGNSVMITIDHQPIEEDGLSLRLRENVGQLVAKVEKQVDLNDLFIEGGATTSVVLKYLNINKLIPFNEADFGVIQMKAEGYPNLCVTTKPGSYLWPEQLIFERTKTN